MRALNRKLLRDLWGMRTQAVAIALVVACAVALFVASIGTYRSLRVAQADENARLRFANVFVSLKRAPRTLLPRIEEVPGVAEVRARVASDVLLEVPGMIEPVTGRLISIPERPSTNTLCGLHLRRGRWIEPGRDDEAIVSESFALAQRLEPGDSISAIVNGRRRRLHIVGVALSPEYVFSIGPGEIFPDDRRFGVFWLGESALAAALDLDGAFNDLAIATTRGASEPEIIARVDRLLEPYGGLGAYGRDRQLSNRYLDSEFQQIRAQAWAIPLIFLGVAAFLLNVVLTRTVAAQRGQIATLRAFGYSRWTIGAHFAAMIVVVVLVGALLAAPIGAYLGGGWTKLYRVYFRFPDLEFQFPLQAFVLASFVALAAGLAGAFGAVMRAVSLAPAEAMRPEMPPSFGRTLLERIGVLRLFSSIGRITARNVVRRPLRAALSTLGIALAGAIVIVGQFGQDSMGALVDAEFGLAERQDVELAFTHPVSTDALVGLSAYAGSSRFEPFRAVPVVLRHEHREWRTAIMGYLPDADLRRGIDATGAVVRPPPEGVTIGRHLASILHVGRGEMLEVEVLEGERRRLRIPVASVVDDLIGANATMDIDALRRAMREPRSISGVSAGVDPTRAATLYARLGEIPGVAAFALREAILRSLERALQENVRILRVMQLGFALVIAFAIVYNAARIAFAERERELASLRVLGMTRAEVSRVLLGEVATFTALAVPLGSVIGVWLSKAAMRAFESDLFRIPVTVMPRSHLFAAVVVLVSTLVSALVVRRRIDKLDLVAVLKSKD